MLRGLGAYAPVDEQRQRRWSWLVDLVGLDNFKKVAELPPERRKEVITTLCKHVKRSIEVFDVP